MTKQTITALLLATMSSSTLVNAQSNDFPGVEKLMGADKFKAAGLDRLSEAERAVLNRWLVEYTAKDAAIVRKSVKEVKEVTQEGYETNIIGTFNGWSGKTVFKLANGQVWQQRQTGNLRVKLESPKVILKEGFLGFYKLHVPELDRSVGVKRIK